VEKAIPHHIEFQVMEVIRWKAGTGKHMMPLQHLVKDDPIKEAAESQPKKDSGNRRKAAPRIPV
jgi:hypothetical protein